MRHTADDFDFIQGGALITPRSAVRTLKDESPPHLTGATIAPKYPLSTTLRMRRKTANSVDPARV